MTYSKLAFVLILFIALTSSLLVPLTLATSNQENAASALKKAEESVASAYQAVLDLKALGGNVTDSLSMLNEAAGFLAEAQVAYRLDKFEDVVRLANLCYDSSNRIKEKTDESLIQAARGQSADAFIRIAGSILGVAVVGVGSFWMWRVFRRRYHQRILKMKPEVSPDGS